MNKEVPFISEEISVPRILYQYLPPPSAGKDTSNLLSARRFKLSQVGRMNDPFDLLPVFVKPDPVRIRAYMEEARIRFCDPDPITPKRVADYVARAEAVRADPLKHWPDFNQGTRLLCLSRKRLGSCFGIVSVQ